MTAPVTVTPPDPNIRTVGHRVTVLEDFLVIDDARGKVVCVPEDFQHDGASIPRIVPQWIVAHDDCGEVAPAVHDRLYRTAGRSGGECRYTRAETDALFRDLMALYGVPAWKRALAYYAVRAFGSKSWQGR